jgi:MraZ protein
MGEFRHSVDAKGRLIVPSRMRDELGETVVLSRWLDGCIAIWSQQGWAEIVGLLKAQGAANAQARHFRRLVTSSAFEEDVDRQGRVLIPPKLRDLAGITKETVVVGDIDHVEIWSPDTWETRQAEVSDGQFEQLAEGLNF